jgi:urease alpha subunit
MIKTPVISKKHRIVTAGTLTVAIQFLAILLVISPQNSGLSVIVMGAVGLSISGAISYVTWNAKRKLKLNY